MRIRIGLLCAFAILLIFPSRVPVIAQSDPALTGSWVGVYEIGEQVNLFFIEWDEAENGYFHALQLPFPSLIRDFNQEAQQIQFRAGTGDSKLVFTGDQVDDNYVGQVHNEDGKGRFYLAPLVELPTGSFDCYIGGYDTDVDETFLVSRGDQANQLFYQEGDHQVRIYPIGEDRFLTARGEELSFHEDYLQRGIPISAAQIIELGGFFRT